LFAAFAAVTPGAIVTSVFHDCWYAVRKLVKSPSFSILVILTLALGIGANTAVFSVVRGIILRPLPYPHAERLVNICSLQNNVLDACTVSPPDMEDWARSSRTIEAAGIARGQAAVLRSDEGVESIPGALASPGFLDLFVAQPARGRLFRRDDLQEPVVILTYGLWQSRYGGDDSIIGRAIMLNDKSHEVIGVLPATLTVPEQERAQVWRPLPFDPRNEENRSWRGFDGVARLAPGVGVEAARNELSGLGARLARELPATNKGWSLTAAPLRERVVGSVGGTLWVFFGAVLFVLLIACTNVASLLLARSLGRRRELAVQAALGAGRARLIRQLLAESLMLGIAGGVLGTLFAWWAVSAFRSLAPPNIPRREEVGVDAAALAFTIAVSLGASLLFGLMPARRAVRTDLMDSLRTAVQAPLARSLFSARRMLVVAEVALAFILLVGAGLLTRSFIAASQWQSGFNPNNLLVVWLLPSTTKYPTKPHVADLYRRTVEEVRTLPGVGAVGAASAGPLFGGRETDEFTLEGAALDPLVARWYDIDASYFQTLGIPLVKGRFFTPDDRATGPRVAIVNETMARRLAADGNPIGRRVVWRGGSPPVTLEIVGVVGDVNPIASAAHVEPEIYWPNQQAPRWATFLVMRTTTDPTQTLKSLKARLATVDPNMSVRTLGTSEQLIGARLVSPRFYMTVLGVFAFVALVLAIGGTYSVISHNVAARTKEIGLRMSLGATPRDVLGLILRQGLQVVIIGIAIGLLGAALLTKLLASLLYRVTALDAVTFVSTAMLLLLAALVAAYIPARRAASVDPLTAIRYE
jgi:putative ABC transport system permease protein